MEDDYLLRLKDMQNEMEEDIRIKEEEINNTENQIATFRKLIKQKKEEINSIDLSIKEIMNGKKDYIKYCYEAKEKNFKLFHNGIKKCLCCNTQTDSNDPLYSVCQNCNSTCWLVGNNYPCEICEKIIFNPLLHHIDGNRENESSENIIFICNHCHQHIHHKPINDDGYSCKDKNVIATIKEYQKLLKNYSNEEMEDNNL